jgi:hypothetical protein
MHPRLYALRNNAPSGSFLCGLNSTCAAESRRYSFSRRTIGHQSYRNISIGRQFATHPKIIRLSSMTLPTGRGVKLTATPGKGGRCEKLATPTVKAIELPWRSVKGSGLASQPIESPSWLHPERLTGRIEQLP